MTSEQLEELLSQFTPKGFAAKKFKDVSSLAKTSFGITFCVDSFFFQLKHFIEQINFIEKQVSDVKTQMSELLKKIKSPITTVPGIGDVIGATILGEIGDINRFSSGAKLVAYAGIDASVSQSGEYECTNNHMSKRGSPYLRKALFRAAFVASNFDPVFKAYYQKKRSEGKHHNVAVGAVARKLCYTIYAVIKNNVPYEIQPPRE